jgi:5-methyltetrahydrofolate--homocysteine methyltransferase
MIKTPSHEFKMSENLTTLLKSKTKTIKISRDLPTTIIGERINPTGRKAVLEALQAGNFEIIRKDALDQVMAGAAVLDINAGVPGADESALIQQIIRNVMEVVDVPLCIDTANPLALAAALSVYGGKALINSVNGEESSMKRVLPLAKEHGAAVIGLCMDGNGIPGTAEQRFAVARRIIERAAKMGIALEDVIIDPLAMAMSADSKAGRIALDTIQLVVREFGVNISMGASNISFGMPDRKYINSTYIAMAIHAGLTCPITNPLVPEVNMAVLAADLSLGRDDYGMHWIKAYRKREKEKAAA